MNIDPQRPLRVLHLERHADTAAQVLSQLHAAGLFFGVRRVATRTALLEALRQYQPDIVVSGDAIDGAAVIEVVSEFSSTLPVVFFMEGNGLGGLVQGAVAQSRAERGRQIVETSARHEELRSRRVDVEQNRWAQRSAEQSLHGLAVAARLRELREERKVG